VEQYTISIQCDELSGLGPLTPEQETDAKKAVDILRRRVGADHGLPDDDDVAILELRELSRAYLGAAKEGTSKRAREEDLFELLKKEKKEKEEREERKAKYDEKVRDGLLSNLALTCGDTELDEAEMPSKEVVEACWQASRSCGTVE
jgi:hypothetical protein